VQIRLYNSSNNNHIALRFAEVTSRQLVMPFMLSKPVTHIRLQIVQRIGGSESILAQEYYRHSGFRLTNLVLDGSTLRIYVRGALWRTVSVTSMTVNRLELTGGAKKLLVDEMFVAPYAATEEEIATWYQAKGAFVDQAEINYQQSQIVQLADSIEASVSAIEEDIDEHGARLTTAEASIIAQAGEIALKAEKTEVYTKTEVDGIVDGIEIGGRNLILNSTFNDEVTIYSGRGSIISKSYNKLIYQNQTGVNAGPLFVFSETLKPSTPYILSFDLKVSQDIVMNYLRLRSGMTTTDIGTNVSSLPNQNLVAGENRVAIPFTLSSSSNGIWLATSIAQEVEFELSNLQLSEGTHATGWTPAPEDVEAEINTVKTDVATLTTNYDSITARVESTEGDINTLTGEIIEVKTRTGQLEVRAGNIEASVSAIEEDVDEHGNRLASVENAVVEVLPGQIALKADASIVDEQGTRITTAEQSINALDGAITHAVARINQSAILKPQGGKLWHFDTSLESTDGIKPLDGAVATLRPNGGRFNGAVELTQGDTLTYQIPSSNRLTFGAYINLEE